jgi:tellurite resistance protein TehA-like permease
MWSSQFNSLPPKAQSLISCAHVGVVNRKPLGSADKHPVISSFHSSAVAFPLCFRHLGAGFYYL